MQHPQQSNVTIEGHRPGDADAVRRRRRDRLRRAERLIEWYLAHGADALFAVAQSSEMQFLCRTRGTRALRGRAGGRARARSSRPGISDDLDAQAEALRAAAESARAGRRARDQSTRSAAQGQRRCSTICSGCSRACRRICRSGCTSARRLTVGCCRMTNCVRASTRAGS